MVRASRVQDQTSTGVTVKFSSGPLRPVASTGSTYQRSSLTALLRRTFKPLPLRPAGRSSVGISCISASMDDACRGWADQCDSLTARFSRRPLAAADPCRYLDPLESSDDTVRNGRLMGETRGRNARDFPATQAEPPRPQGPGHKLNFKEVFFTEEQVVGPVEYI